MSQINVTTIRNRTGGAPNLDQGIVVGAAATFSGNVSVQSGIRVGAGESIGSTTSTENVVYYGDGSKLTGVESWNQQDTWLYGGG